MILIKIKKFVASSKITIKEKKMQERLGETFCYISAPRMVSRIYIFYKSNNQKKITTQRVRRGGQRLG